MLASRSVRSSIGSKLDLMNRDWMRILADNWGSDPGDLEEEKALGIHQHAGYLGCGEIKMASCMRNLKGDP